MSAGILIDEFGQSISVASNSCADVIAGYLAGIGWPPEFGNGATCTANPVVPGASIFFHYPNGNSGQYLVSSISATSGGGSGAVSEPPPTYITCSSACTVNLKHEFSLPPLQLSSAEGAQIAVAVIAVWAVGFCIRMVIRVLNVDRVSSDNEDS